ncbi:hypothetical protein DORLON_02565 [Dorea longicatena DSM 13814]|uniref:Uncharacterized protein n=1 Tax=Dorea longicatena DSM 13814 TaxID=411462 RepID=A6BJS0_9FIRM|nr:hypothetical protein DORLON_02565 [Dorea longicatena DSM 13814]
MSSVTEDRINCNVRSSKSAKFSDVFVRVFIAVSADS